MFSKFTDISLSSLSWMLGGLSCQCVAFSGGGSSGSTWCILLRWADHLLQLASSTSCHSWKTLCPGSLGVSLRPPSAPLSMLLSMTLLCHLSMALPPGLTGIVSMDQAVHQVAHCGVWRSDHLSKARLWVGMNWDEGVPGGRTFSKQS